MILDHFIMKNTITVTWATCTRRQETIYKSFSSEKLGKKPGPSTRQERYGPSHNNKWLNNTLCFLLLIFASFHFQSTLNLFQMYLCSYLSFLLLYNFRNSAFEWDILLQIYSCYENHIFVLYIFYEWFKLWKYFAIEEYLLTRYLFFRVRYNEYVS